MQIKLKLSDRLVTQRDAYLTIYHLGQSLFRWRTSYPTQALYHPLSITFAFICFCKKKKQKKKHTHSCADEIKSSLYQLNRFLGAFHTFPFHLSSLKYSEPRHAKLSTQTNLRDSPSYCAFILSLKVESSKTIPPIISFLAQIFG